MNAGRMFAFVAAVLITAFLACVVVYTATFQQPIHGAAAAVIVRGQSTVK
jgi:cell division septal protein FtsQ